ncbi:MAG: hypothetical protein JWO06_420 [Bacteroidota bacterium]|nr:hypothetical protein [Bacteroidota bacterium]
MQKLLALLTTLFFCLAVKAQTIKTMVYFDNAQYAIKPEEKQKLIDLVNEMKRRKVGHPISTSVIGHTDWPGSYAANDTLSKKRAIAVYQCLDTLFKADTISNAHMSYSFAGKRNWIYPADDKVNAPLNRRVEIAVNYWVPDRFTDDDSIQALYRRLKADYGYQDLQFSRNKLVSTQSKTLLYYADSATAKLQEAHSVSEILALNLSSTANYMPIATEGMYLLNMSDGADTTDPFKGKKLLIIKPLQDTTALLFTGDEQQNGHLTKMNWKDPQKPLIAPVLGSDIIAALKRDTVATLKLSNKKRHRCGLKEMMNAFRSKKMKALDEKRSNDYAALTLRRNQYMDSLKNIFENRKIENIDKAIQPTITYIIFEYIMPAKYISVNCDYFPKFGKPLVNYTVNIPPSINVDVKLVFEDYKVIYPGRPDAVAFNFDHVPNGYKAQLVAIRYIDKMPQLAVKEVTMGGKAVQLSDLEFIKYSNLNDFKLALALLNK